MEDFRKMYRPILKPVKPGQKRTLSNVEDGKGDSPKFDFSKKFAEIIKRDLDDKERINPDSNDRKEEGSLKNDSSQQLPPKLSSTVTKGVFSNTNDNNKDDDKECKGIIFKPAGLCKLDLSRAGLLQPPKLSQKVTKDPPSDLASDPETTSISSFPSISSDSDIEIPKISPTSTGTNIIPEDNGEEGEGHLNRLDERSLASPGMTGEKVIGMEEEGVNGDDSVVIDKSNALDKGCKLSGLEGDLPATLSLLDEKIAMLHNLKLDFMLELGCTNA